MFPKTVSGTNLKLNTSEEGNALQIQSYFCPLSSFSCFTVIELIDIKEPSPSAKLPMRRKIRPNLGEQSIYSILLNLTEENLLAVSTSKPDNH